MKISFKLIVVILAFLFIICLTMCSCSNVMPYSFSSSSKLPQYSYEGFSEYTTYPNNKSIDSNESQLFVPEQGPIRVSGFDGLVDSPNAPETKIDTFSQALGENTWPYEFTWIFVFEPRTNQTIDQSRWKYVIRRCNYRIIVCIS